MTLPEVVLWQILRKWPEGVQFRRQHPAGRYVLDFYCATANLALEVDGAVHGLGEQAARDSARDGWLREQGIEVLRFTANDVLKNIDGVVQSISLALRDR